MNNDRTTITNTYTSELPPDWNKVTLKTALKKHSQVQVVVGGLGDSDAAAINPFSSQDTSKAQKPQTKSSSKVVTMKQDFSCQNKVRAPLSNTSNYSQLRYHSSLQRSLLTMSCLSQFTHQNHPPRLLQKSPLPLAKARPKKKKMDYKRW